MERKLGTYGLADFYAEHKRKRPNFLDAVAGLIKWERIEKLLRKKLGRSEENAAGVKAYPSLVMFKVLLLQSWHNLSDLDMEYSLADRNSFVRFAGFSLEDETPDHTTICRFRNLLLKRKLLDKLLDEVNGQLQAQGKLIKKGSIVDASIISSSAHPTKQVDIENVSEDRKEEASSPDLTVTVRYSVDTEAAWTKKGTRYFYGYKAHVATDSQDGFILSAHVTPANRADTVEFSKVVAKANLAPKARVYADKGYTSESNTVFLREKGLRSAIMNKAVRNRPLEKRERQRNRCISAIRSTVERIFGTLKRGYGLSRASYIGRAKVELEFMLCAIAYNLKKAVLLPSI